MITTRQKQSVVLLFSWLLFVGIIRVQCQTRTTITSEGLPVEIFKSLLKLEIKTQEEDFESLRTISSENISFTSTWLLEQGFTLIPQTEIERQKKESIVSYVVVRSINYPRDGVVAIRLARVREGRPCFSAAFSTQQTFTYEFRQEEMVGTKVWVGRLASRSLPSTLKPGWPRLY
jgi:hypothetical protein